MGRGKVLWLLPRSQKGDEAGRLPRAHRPASPHATGKPVPLRASGRFCPITGAPHRHLGPTSSSLTIFQGKCNPHCTCGETEAAGWKVDAAAGAPTAILDLKADVEGPQSRETGEAWLPGDHYSPNALSQRSVSHSWGCRGPTAVPASKKSEAGCGVPPTQPNRGVTLKTLFQIGPCTLSTHLATGGGRLLRGGGPPGDPNLRMCVRVIRAHV